MTTKDTAYKSISELVEKFDDQKEFYKKSDYNETTTRIHFIDPFFEALGWDMNNKQGAWEAYREVIHEDKLKISGQTKAPDYSFRLLGGQRLFFVEAKKPSIAVKDDDAPAYQVRLYGWNAKLPLSIVTDFEEFAIYDCTKKPLRTDKASKGRLNYFTYNDYLNNFDFFWNTFSREQVIKGGLVKFQRTEKKGTATVDKEFLESLDEWRKLLAANIYKNNPDISEDDLNYTVQQNIDRIIFLRIAEDRALEPFGQLKSCLQNEEHYQELYRQFRVADDKYNSGLFHFRKEKDNNEAPDTISGSLKVDNKVIKSIVKSLYPPDSDYLFNVLPVEILGSAYEQFLGKQIIIKGHRADIEEKPEVRKAGGVYYTPQYIVDYIVQQTVGKLCEGKNVNEIAKLKIVDPACGSGSFLLGAYQYLLNKHLELYKDMPAGKKREAVLTPDGNLTTAEKKRILLNNIYGVDIDRNAVEVTKLSLLLKCMEGETQASLNTQMTFFHERALPSLEKNIKSGNSLIDLDFYDGEFDFEPGAEKKIKPFSWKQAFPEVFKNGGFDAVIGNPPWGAGLNDYELKYLKKKHSSIVIRMVDSYIYFMNFSIDLLKQNGIYGVIIPSTFLNQIDVGLLRKKILNETTLSCVINLGEKIFGPKVLNTSTIITLYKKKDVDENVIVGDLRDREVDEKANLLNTITPSNRRYWYEMVSNNDHFIYLTYNLNNLSILEKLKSKGLKFVDIIDGEIQRGISPDYAKAFILNKTEAANLNLEKEVLRPLVLGRHIIRYNEINSDDVIIYLTKKDDINKYPNVKRHLEQYRKFITCREVVEGKHPWYALHRPRDPEIFTGKKIIGLTTSKVICTSIDSDNYYATDALYLFKIKKEIGIAEEYVIAIIQSKLFQLLYDLNIQGGQRVIPQIKAANLYDLPFPNQDKKLHDQIVVLVKTILSLHKEKQQTTSPEKLEQLHQRINYTDEKINQLVYQLYGLSEEEIKIVEGN